MPNILKTFRAGDSFSLTFDDETYPAADGWGLTYTLVGPSKQEIEAILDESQYLVEESATNTAVWEAGTYWVYAVFSLGSDKHTLEYGQTEVLAVLGETLDNRSHVKRTLDALEAMIEGKATDDVQSYSIGDRQLSKMTPTELLTWYDKYKRLYKAELNQGKSSIIKARMP